MKRAILLLMLLGATTARAARIGDVVETSAWEQAHRFFTFRDPALQLALWGSLLLGLCCGLLGAFLVVRKMALVGDTLSHAVLPGVAAGFLWNMSKDPLAIFIGAALAGLLGTMVVSWLTRATRLKEDAALGIVLAVFYAVGVCMIGIIQRLPTGAKSGLDQFFFGQAAALTGNDLALIAGITALTILLLNFFYKEFLVTSFDVVFARTLGLPVRTLHHTLMFLLASAVVVALQAVGVVLVSAMLVTPAAAAYLLTDRMHRMLSMSALFGMLAGALGAFFSFLGNQLPTGPFMVLSAATIFAVAFLFSPIHGVIPRWRRKRQRATRVAHENTLKGIYLALESGDFRHESISIEALATQRRVTLEAAWIEACALQARGYVISDEMRRSVRLTPEGRRQAEIVVRNHRLWELYLANMANYRADHVHADAEEIEHILGEETVRMLERRLNFPEHDPHGKSIPRPQ